MNVNGEDHVERFKIVPELSQVVVNVQRRLATLPTRSVEESYARKEPIVIAVNLGVERVSS